MKYFRTIAVAAGLACAAASSRADITLDFSSTTDSEINFTPSGFSFINTVSSANPTLHIDSSTGAGDSVGDLGSITGGPFVITSISGSTATVTGTGTLSIDDGHGHDLTGTVTWNTIGQIGTFNGLNVNGLLNLSTITYSGSQLDLQTLASYKTGVQTVGFSFAIPTPPGPPSLAQLQAGGYNTSFSGQIFASTSVLPEPTTVIAGALLLLPFGLGALRSFRKNSASVA
jgi:hypothetical protein